MDQAGDVGHVLLQVRCRAVQERRQVAYAEARGVILDLAEQRIATTTQNTTNGANSVAMVECGAYTRRLTDRTLTTLRTQKARPHQRDLR